VEVPLDRGDPLAGLIPIHFELYVHTDPRPAESAIIVNFGGPGASTTAMRSIPRLWCSGDALLRSAARISYDLRIACLMICGTDGALVVSEAGR
jgi:hypothetical protein